MAVKNKALTSLKNQLEKSINRFSSIFHIVGSFKSFENVDIEVRQSDIQDLAEDHLGVANDD